LLIDIAAEMTSLKQKVNESFVYVCHFFIKCVISLLHLERNLRY